VPGAVGVAAGGAGAQAATSSDADNASAANVRDRTIENTSWLVVSDIRATVRLSNVE
jgi:hypothetical protein